MNTYTDGQIWIWAIAISAFAIGIGWHLRGIVERRRGNLRPPGSTR